MCVQFLSGVRPFEIPWTVARQAPLYLKFSRQEWVAISSSGESSWPQGSNPSCLPCISCFGRHTLLTLSHLGSPQLGTKRTQKNIKIEGTGNHFWPSAECPGKSASFPQAEMQTLLERTQLWPTGDRRVTMTLCWQDSLDICPQRLAMHAPTGLEEKAACGELLSRGTLLKYAQGGGLPGEAVSPCALQDPVVSQVPCRRPPSKHQDQRAKSFPPAISAQHPLLKKLNTESASKRKKLKGPDSFFTKQAKSLNLELNSNKSISTFYLIFCLLNIMLIHFVNLNEFLHLLGVYTPLFFQTLFLGNIASPPGILWMRVQFLRRSWYCSPGTYEMGLFQ